MQGRFWQVISNSEPWRSWDIPSGRLKSPSDGICSAAMLQSNKSWFSRQNAVFKAFSFYFAMLVIDCLLLFWLRQRCGKTLSGRISVNDMLTYSKNLRILMMESGCVADLSVTAGDRLPADSIFAFIEYGTSDGETSLLNLLIMNRTMYTWFSAAPGKTLFVGVQIPIPQPKTFPILVREGFTFSLFTLHFSLNRFEKFFGRNK